MTIFASDTPPVRKPPIMLYTYPGGKWRLAKKYSRYYPPHHHFVSVFGGSGAEIALKPPSPLETLNDKDDLIYNVFVVLRDDALREQLVRLLDNTPDGRSQYMECHRIMTRSSEPVPSVRKAWAYLVCATTGYHGPHPVKTRSWSMYRRAKHSTTHRLIALPETIQAWKDRFRQVRLENTSWQRVIDQYDAPDTFFFCDPPYHPEVCSSGLYCHEMTAEEHAELLERLARVKGRVLLCGINHPLYEEHLFYWRRVSFETRTTMTRTSDKPKRKEEIWLNFEADGAKVHDHRSRITERFVATVGGVEEAERYIQRYKRFLNLPE